MLNSEKEAPFVGIHQKDGNNTESMNGGNGSICTRFHHLFRPEYDPLADGIPIGTVVDVLYDESYRIIVKHPTEGRKMFNKSPFFTHNMYIR